MPAVFLVALGFWLLVGLIDSTWYYFTALQKAVDTKQIKIVAESRPWSAIFLFNLPYWLIVAGLTPPVVWLTRRFGFLEGRPWRAALAHGLALVPFAALHVGLFRLVRIMGGGWPAIQEKLPMTVRAELSVSLDKEILFYVVIAGGVTAGDYYRRYQEKARATAALELEQARLHASLSEARLGALRMQLEPHFLFNALHAISTLILRGDARAAHEMLQHLSGFLRMTLDSGDAPVVTLAVELEFLDAYLRIQRARFGERLRVVLEIDEGARAAQVPCLILQPLVENAVRHGVGTDPGEVVVAVRARAGSDLLRLEVEDHGRGLLSAEHIVEGVGLANIRARLEQLYPDAHRFTLAPAPGGGTVATIEIPLRVASGYDRESPARGRASIASAAPGTQEEGE